MLNYSGGCRNVYICLLTDFVYVVLDHTFKYFLLLDAVLDLIWLCLFFRKEVHCPFPLY
jgi:hypothetical protein